MTTSEARYKILLAQKKIERAKIKIKELKLFIESKEGRREDILKDRGQKKLQGPREWPINCQHCYRLQTFQDTRKPGNP